MKKANVSILASFLLVALILTSCGELGKMAKMAPQVRYEVTPKVLEMNGDSVEATIKVTFPTKFFQKKAILEITPVLKYEGGEKAFKTLTLQGEDVQANNQSVSFISGGTFTITSKIVFEEGMRKATLVGRVKAIVGEDNAELPEVKLADGVMSSALLLEKDAMVIAADNKFVRITTDSKDAAIHFVINQATIRGQELKKEEMKALKDFVDTYATKENVEFKGVEISAYASPDGELDLNTKLADKRMSTSEKYFARELKKAKVAGLEDANFISAKSTPEDWDGFKKLMQESEIQDKELILRVLSMYSDPVVREKEIKNIAAAYEQIAEDVLPQLRRSKLTVNIAIIGYSDEELKELAIANADTLKVEELMYAASILTDKNQKLAVYQKVAANFADDWRGHNNSGYILYNQGKYAEAKAAFEEAKKLDASNSTVLNNLGACAHMEGDVTAAKEFYNAAAGAGNQVSYNQALIAAKTGNYENALNLFVSSKMNTFNFALVKMLNYSITKNADTYDAALGILTKVENQDAANVYYLKAILGARKQDTDLLFNNLRTAIEKDASYKAYALKDIEFAQYAADGTFKTIVE
ncbi:MAG: tetratricopeptide repeat protein [Salinivirgaceae bacterium]|nr:tetratricopeptide repeat protein [Salinivirgaceae bacterium]